MVCADRFVVLIHGRASSSCVLCVEFFFAPCSTLVKLFTIGRKGPLQAQHMVQIILRSRSRSMIRFRFLFFGLKDPHSSKFILVFEIEKSLNKVLHPLSKLTAILKGFVIRSGQYGNVLNTLYLSRSNANKQFNKFIYS